MSAVFKLKSVYIFELVERLKLLLFVAAIATTMQQQGDYEGTVRSSSRVATQISACCVRKLISARTEVS